MPFSLAEHAVAQRHNLTKGVMLGIVMESVIADILSWRPTGALQVEGIRYDSVNQPSYIPINGTIPESTVRGKPLSYSVYRMAMHIDIDTALSKDNSAIERPETRQQTQTIKGAAYKLNQQFVNGDQATDANGPDGLEKFVGNLAAAQTVGSSEIDISGAPTSAVMHSFMDRLDQAIHTINGHGPTFALCNDTFALRARSVFRREGLLGDNHNWVRDGFPFGNVRQTVRTKSTKPIMILNGYGDGIPFYDIGPTDADNATRIIGNAYNEGGSSAATRVYFVKMSEEDFEGLQYSAPGFKSIGLLEDKEAMRWRYTWDHGWGLWSPDGLVKMAGVKVA